MSKEPTDADRELADECHPVTDAESLAELIAEVRLTERMRCSQICIRNMDEWNTAGWMACAEEILREIEKG